MSAPTQEVVVRRVLPALGCASYGLFSVNIMDPDLFQSLLPAHVQVANCLWFNAHVGVGVYLFNRKHLKKTTVYNRVMYSAFGTFVFNFGSVLFWATLKALLPENRAARLVVGASSAAAFLAIGKEYMNLVDSEEEVD